MRPLAAKLPEPGTIESTGPSAILPQIQHPGLLAELADAVDSKSTAPNQKTPENHGDSENANCTLRGPCANRTSDTDLAGIIAAWPDLPGDVRKMIAGVVKATTAAQAAVAGKAGREA